MALLPPAVPGADGDVILPEQRALEAEPGAGQHPEGAVALYQRLPAEAALLRRQGGGNLQVVEQGGGLADAPPVGVHPLQADGLLIKQAHGFFFPRIKMVCLQQMSSMSSAVAAGMRIWAPHWAQIKSTEL